MVKGARRTGDLTISWELIRLYTIFFGLNSKKIFVSWAKKWMGMKNGLFNWRERQLDLGTKIYIREE